MVEVAPEEGWSTSETVGRAVRSLDYLSASEERFLLSVHLPGPAALLPRGLAELDGEIVDAAGVLRQRYEAAVADTLAELAVLVAAIDRLDDRDDVLLIVMGSSGYELFEHGGLGSGWTVLEEAIRVPLVLRWPERIEPASAAAPVSTLGVVATVIEQFARSTPTSGELDAEPLLSLEGASYVADPPASPPIAEVVVREWAISRAVVGDRYKYVHTTRTAPPEDRAALERGIEELQAAMLSGSVATPPLFARPVDELLFDLERDPGEQTSVLDEGPDTLGRAETSATRVSRPLRLRCVRPARDHEAPRDRSRPGHRAGVARLSLVDCNSGIESD